MQKIISVILITAMLAPNAARWLAYSACKIEKVSSDEKDFCLCSLNNIYSDNNNQTSFPDKQKEITEQTDWKYLAKTQLKFIYRLDCPKALAGHYRCPCCSFSFINDIFHPPCFG